MRARNKLADINVLIRCHILRTNMEKKYVKIPNEKQHFEK